MYVRAFRYGFEVTNVGSRLSCSLGFKVLGIKFWVLGLGFGVWGFGFWVLGFGFWVWVLGFGFGFRVMKFTV